MLDPFQKNFNQTILAYFKLGNGGFEQAREINFRNPLNNNPVIFSDE